MYHILGTPTAYSPHTIHVEIVKHEKDAHGKRHHKYTHIQNVGRQKIPGSMCEYVRIILLQSVKRYQFIPLSPSLPICPAVFLSFCRSRCYLSVYAHSNGAHTCVTCKQCSMVRAYSVLACVSIELFTCDFQFFTFFSSQPGQFHLTIRWLKTSTEYIFTFVSSTFCEISKNTCNYIYQCVAFVWCKKYFERKIEIVSAEPNNWNKCRFAQ